MTENCKDIARELFENSPGKDFNVILGGGLTRLIPESESDGRRKDGKYLIETWKELHPNGKHVTNRDELLSVGNVDHLLGIFANSHLEFNYDRKVNNTNEPSLVEMTLSALKILKNKNSRGFLLMVEGAKIDLAHHRNKAYRALDDTLAFDEAIQGAVDNSGEFILNNCWEISYLKSS